MCSNRAAGSEGSRTCKFCVFCRDRGHEPPFHWRVTAPPPPPLLAESALRPPALACGLHGCFVPPPPAVMRRLACRARVPRRLHFPLVVREKKRLAHCHVFPPFQPPSQPCDALGAAEARPGSTCTCVRLCRCNDDRVVMSFRGPVPFGPIIKPTAGAGPPAGRVAAVGA